MRNDLVQGISPSELKQLMDNGEVFLVDVRQPGERDAFHIGGQHIPMDEALRSNTVFPENIPVVFYCEKGIRSALVIQRISARYSSVKMLNLEGGVEAWKKTFL